MCSTARPTTSTAVSNMIAFEEKLISAVFLRPCIYDKSNPDHMKKGMLDAAWTGVTTEAGKSREDCKKRWKSLKDTYFKHRKFGPSGSGSDGKQRKWVWFEHLSFLGNFNDPLGTSDNFEGEDSQLELISVDSLEGVESEQASERDPEPAITNQSTTPLSTNNSGNRGRKRATVAQQWGDAFDRIAKTESNSVPAKDISVVSSFSTFIGCEMQKLNEQEQDEFKWGVMDVLKVIKQRRQFE